MAMRPTIILADDFPPFLEKLVSFLEPEFDIVATARCGKSALEAIRRCEPDVAVTDLNMPGLNGIEVTRELAKYPFSPPIVVYSTEADPEMVQAVRQAGAVAYVVKSRLGSDLIPALNSAVRQRIAVQCHS